MTSRIKALWARVSGLIPIFPSFPPNTDEYGCAIVDEHNFQDVVIRNNKDVLVVFYTPAENDPLEPVFRDLVKTYEKDSKVVIARCDIAHHDVPVKIYNVPTIKFYPAKKKRYPAHYFGNMEDAEQLKRFIQEESVSEDTPTSPLSRRSTTRSTLDAVSGENGGEK